MDDFLEIKKRVKFDAFPHILVVVLTNDVHISRHNLEKLFGEGPNRPNMEAMHIGNGCGLSYILLPWNSPPETIAHEAYHCICSLFKDIGAKHEEEMFAYLLSYVVKEIFKFRENKWPLDLDKDI